MVQCVRNHLRLSIVRREMFNKLEGSKRYKAVWITGFRTFDNGRQSAIKSISHKIDRSYTLPFIT